MIDPSLYIDFHTHRPPAGAHTILYNQIVKDHNAPVPTGAFSVGVHPWYIHDPEAQLALLEKILQEKNCLALGECGLDHECQTPFDLQEKVFAEQCRLALQYKKPLVIHAVRTHFEIMRTLKEMGIKKAVFHGFNQRYTILEKVLENGFYVSMGAALEKGNSSAAALIGNVPVSQLFLETDDSDLPIEKIYALASEKTGKSIEALQEQLQINFKQLLTL